MNSLYPWYVPNPEGKEPPHDKILVKNPDEHKKVNPEHFEREMAKLKQKNEPEATSQEVLKERERCARVAESMQRGNKLGDQIAAAIRSALAPGKVMKLAPAGDPSSKPIVAADAPSDSNPDEQKADPAYQSK